VAEALARCGASALVWPGVGSGRKGERSVWFGEGSCQVQRAGRVLIREYIGKSRGVRTATTGFASGSPN